MPAGILLKEYATDPSIGMPQPLCEQHVACGPAPSVSQPFSQQTRFIVLKLGTSPPHNEDRAVHCEIGLDPLPSLIADWRAGTLGEPLGPLSNEPVVREVGPGARLAVLGLNLGSHDHPPSPTFPDSAGEAA
jgi:hypothetical protein